ncbi:MAG: hypothetical protein QOC82_2404 [Frankiaceae bacterium]|nr:hypothetical protein [Frankiaceae bacterium]
MLVAAVLVLVPAVSGCKARTARPVAAATTPTSPSPAATTPAPSPTPRPVATHPAAIRTVSTPTPTPTHTRPAPPPPTCRKAQIEVSFRMNAVDFARGEPVTFTTVIRNHSASACGIYYSVPCYDSVAVVTPHSHWVWTSGNCELRPPPPEPTYLAAHGRLTFVAQWDQRPSCTPVGCGPTPPPRVAPGRYLAHATCLVSYDDNNYIYVSSQQIGFTIES